MINTKGKYTPYWSTFPSFISYTLLCLPPTPPFSCCLPPSQPACLCSCPSRLQDISLFLLLSVLFFSSTSLTMAPAAPLHPQHHSPPSSKSLTKKSEQRTHIHLPSLSLSLSHNLNQVVSLSFSPSSDFLFLYFLYFPLSSSIQSLSYSIFSINVSILSFQTWVLVKNERTI